MPNQNGSGPEGMGPRTGRGLGNCEKPSTEVGNEGRGLGRGQGLGQGQGRGLGRGLGRGRGRCRGF